MKDLSDALQGKFFGLVCGLEPENLQRDGEASKAEATKQETFLLKQWRDLEYLVGRKVSKDEIWDKEYAKHRKV